MIHLTHRGRRRRSRARCPRPAQRPRPGRPRRARDRLRGRRGRRRSRAAAARRGPGVLRGPRHLGRRPAHRRRDGLPRRPRRAAAAADERVPRADLRRRARRVPRRRPGAADRDRCRLRRRHREDRLAVREPRRDPRLGRARALLRAARRAQDARPDLHRPADVRRRGGAGGPVLAGASRPTRCSPRRGMPRGRPRPARPRRSSRPRRSCTRCATSASASGTRSTPRTARRPRSATPTTTARASRRSRRSGARPSRGSADAHRASGSQRRGSERSSAPCTSSTSAAAIGAGSQLWFAPGMRPLRGTRHGIRDRLRGADHQRHGLLPDDRHARGCRDRRAGRAAAPTRPTPGTRHPPGSYGAAATIAAQNGARFAPSSHSGGMSFM